MWDDNLNFDFYTSYVAAKDKASLAGRPIVPIANRLQIMVHDGKGFKDRVTVLPERLKGELQPHLERVKVLHEEDLRLGLGAVWLPGALRVKYPGRRLWAIFEPRSNTTRRNVFQQELAEALRLADAVIVSQIARLELLGEHERLDPARLMREVAANGIPAHYLATVPEIVECAGTHGRVGDVFCVFTNGGFENIHEKLLHRFSALPA